MSNTEKAFLSTLQLLRTLHETELYDFELGFPTIETWEACFTNPADGTNYEVVEAAHARLMYSQKRLNEVKSRLFFSGPHEFLHEVHKTLTAWTSDYEKLVAWLVSEEGGMIDDEETALARGSEELFQELLEEIGGSCPFRLVSDEQSTLPLYHELDRDVRIHILSALGKWACYYNLNVIDALHADVLEIARSEPIGFDKAGNAYYWFQEVAPYRLYKEIYANMPTKIMFKLSEVEKNVKSVKIKRELDSQKAKRVTGDGEERKMKKDDENQEPTKPRKYPSRAASMVKSNFNEEDESENEGEDEKTLSPAKTLKKMKKSPSKYTKSSDEDEEESFEEEKRPSKSRSKQGEGSKKSPTKNENEAEFRYTSSGRVIRLPPPIQQFSQQQPPSKRTRVESSATLTEKQKPSTAKSTETRQKKSTSTKPSKPIEEDLEDEDDTIIIARDFAWPDRATWECLTRDSSSLMEFIQAMITAKEDVDLVKALRHVRKWADEIHQEMLDNLEDVAEARREAIQKYQIRLANEELEEQRRARNANLRASHPNTSLLGGPVQLRRSGRVTKPTEVALLNASRKDSYDDNDDDDDSDDEFPVSERHRRFLRPSAGTRRSSRLAKLTGTDIPDDGSSSSGEYESDDERGDAMEEENSKEEDEDVVEERHDGAMEEDEEVEDQRDGSIEDEAKKDSQLDVQEKDPDSTMKQRGTEDSESVKDVENTNGIQHETGQHGGVNEATADTGDAQNETESKDVAEDMRVLRDVPCLTVDDVQ